MDMRQMCMEEEVSEGSLMGQLHLVDASNEPDKDDDDR